VEGSKFFAFRSKDGMFLSTTYEGGEEKIVSAKKGSIGTQTARESTQTLNPGAS